MTVRYTRRNVERHHNVTQRRLCCSGVKKYRHAFIFVVGTILGLTVAFNRQRYIKLSSYGIRHPLQPDTSNTTSIAVMIVLGEMLVNGTQASNNLKSRLRAARDVLDSFHVNTDDGTAIQHVIFSGGDTARVNQTEASVMKQLWEARFEQDNEIIRNDQKRNITIHLEHQSLSTCQNAYYSIPILQRIRQTHHGSQPLRVILVTSDYHVARAQLLLEQVFQTVLSLSSSPPSSSQKSDSILQIDKVVGAPTMDKNLRKQLFQNERHWLQPKNLKKLLHQMKDHPFLLPTTSRTQEARMDLDRWEQAKQ